MLFDHFKDFSKITVYTFMVRFKKLLNFAEFVEHLERYCHRVDPHGRSFED